MFKWDMLVDFIKPFSKLALILVIGHFICVYLLKFISRGFEKTRLDKSLQSFLLKALNILLHILVVMSALSSIGISTSGILAAISAVGVAVAVGLKDSLSNVAGGILLLLSPRFSAGDYIRVGGDEGSVTAVDLLHTAIKTTDNKLIYIPNGVLINSNITNYSREQKRRVDIVFSIPYDADCELAKKIMLDVISNHPLALNKPEEPFARVIKYSESSVDITTRVWCNTSDYWTLYFDIIEQTRGELKKNNIDLPFNQLDVHMK